MQLCVKFFYEFFRYWLGVFIFLWVLSGCLLVCEKLKLMMLRIALILRCKYKY